MLPSQTIDVAGQAFTPDRSSAPWLQPIEPAPRGNIECLESGLPLRVSHRWFPDPNFDPCMLCLVHPATRSSSVCSRSSSPSTFAPVKSRPGARFPGLRYFGAVDGCA